MTATTVKATFTLPVYLVEKLNFLYPHGKKSQIVKEALEEKINNMERRMTVAAIDHIRSLKLFRKDKRDSVEIIRELRAEHDKKFGL